MEGQGVKGGAPRVTVLMTYYNKRAYLLEAVHSVLASTFKDLELLLVDDASTDGGLELVRAIGDPRIRILESAVNTGRAAAANRGYDAARGEYVAVMDADDVMHPERLAEQVAYMDQHPEVGALGTYAEILGTGANMSPYQLDDAGCRAGLLLGDPLWYGAAMFRRAVLDAHGLRCDAAWRLPGMDYLFLLEVGRHTRYANLRRSLMRYRIGEQNMRHGRDPVKDRIALFAEAFRRFGIEAGREEARLHVMLFKLFDGPPTTRDVHALRAWLDRLQRMDRVKELFPLDLFIRFAEARWNGLFHALADRSWALAWAHMRASGRPGVGKVYYAMKAALDRRRRKTPA